MWSAFSRLFAKNNIPVQPSTTVDTPESMDKQPQAMDSFDSKQVSISLNYTAYFICYIVLSLLIRISESLEMEFVISRC